MKIQHGKLEYWFQTGFKQNSKCFVICTKCAIKNFKPCSTKQPSNMFKLWCEWG